MRLIKTIKINVEKFGRLKLRPQIQQDKILSYKLMIVPWTSG